jgi:hypothetical protein
MASTRATMAEGDGAERAMFWAADFMADSFANW